MASSKPAPSAWPLTAATTGKGARCTASMASCSEVMSVAAPAASRSRSTRTSMPPVKARPAPVSTASRTVGIGGQAHEGGAEGGDQARLEQVERRTVERAPHHAASPLDADGGLGHQYRCIAGSIVRAQSRGHR